MIRIHDIQYLLGWGAQDKLGEKSSQFHYELVLALRYGITQLSKH